MAHWQIKIRVARSSSYTSLFTQISTLYTVKKKKKKHIWFYSPQWHVVCKWNMMLKLAPYTLRLLRCLYKKTTTAEVLICKSSYHTVCFYCWQLKWINNTDKCGWKFAIFVSKRISKALACLRLSTSLFCKKFLSLAPPLPWGKHEIYDIKITGSNNNR